MGFSMLDQNVIAQLSKLKKDIVASKDIAEGTVIGSSGRYGFVKLDDGRNAFLNPEKMQRVIPGDRIRVNVVKNDKDQLEAEFEEFLSTELNRFVGQYKVKNGAHFVAPENEQISRWIFIPPQFRQKIKENDWVLAELLHHPYEDGKASAKCITRIGTLEDDYINHNLVIARFGIHRHWSKDAINQAKQCAKEASKAHGEDLNSVPFVTIDNALTKDMDDAVYVERCDSGWKLHVAIANPAAFILPGSPIAKAAKYFGQSVYLPGKSLPMLPESLATETFSLVAGAAKPALVCTIDIDNNGEIKHFEFKEAQITSKGKLNYVDVSQFLDGDESALQDCGDEIKASLKALDEMAKCRAEYRSAHNLVFEDQLDYDIQLNKHGLIESISQREKTRAHRLVEESMIAANLSAGAFLAEHQTGVFNTHRGFRPERIGEVRALLREELGDDNDYSEIENFDGFLALIKNLQTSQTHQHILPPLKRMMQAAELSNEPAPHMGMGFQYYATITSPIRRYADISNQWSILKVLNKLKAQKVPDPVVEQLKDSVSNSRQASRQLEQILWANYLNDKKGLEGKAVIRIITQQGFGVRLLETGIEGFVQFGKKVDKQYDAKRMTITIADQTFALDTTVDVRVTDVDLTKRRVKMEVVGLKLPEKKKPEEKTEKASAE